MQNTKKMNVPKIGVNLIARALFKLWLRPSALFNRTKIIRMTTSVSRRSNILCIMLKIISSFILTLSYFLFFYLLVTEWILLFTAKRLF
jgi:hypothetical protein